MYKCELYLYICALTCIHTYIIYLFRDIKKYIVSWQLLKEPFHLPVSLFTSLYLMLAEYPVMYQQDKEILSVTSFITFPSLSIVVVINLHLVP